MHTGLGKQKKLTRMASESDPNAVHEKRATGWPIGEGNSGWKNVGLRTSGELKELRVVQTTLM